MTMLLVVFGFTALLQAVGVGLFAGSENENDLIAVHLAQEKVEDLRNTSYAGIVDGTEIPVTGFSVFDRTVTAAESPQGLKEVTVTVTWDTKAGQSQVVLVTYISDDT